MRSAAAVCRDLCVAKHYDITKRAQTLDRVHLSRALQPDFDGRTVQFLIRLVYLRPSFGLFPVGR